MLLFRGNNQDSKCYSIEEWSRRPAQFPQTQRRRERLVRRRRRKRRRGNLVSSLLLDWLGPVVSASLLMNHLISRVGGGRDGN